jgi:hypothetical protein
VVWISNFNDLVATFLILAGLLFFSISLDQQGPSERPATAAALATLAISWTAMILAILTKESAYVFPLLLILLLAVPGDSIRWGIKDVWSAWRRRLPSLIPFFGGALLLFAYRWKLLGGIGGYRDAHNVTQASHLGLSTLHLLFGRLWGVLYFPVNWTKVPSLVLVGLAVFYIASLIWLAAAWIRRSRPDFRNDLLFAIGFTLVAALPPLHLLMIGTDLSKARLLYLPSVGFCLFLAVATRALSRPAKAAVMVTVLAFHCAVLQHNIGPWQYASEKSQAACRAAAVCTGGSVQRIATRNLPGILHGVYFFANGFSECVDRASAGLPPQTRTNGPVALSWDGAKDELICRPVGP